MDKSQVGVCRPWDGIWTMEGFVKVSGIVDWRCMDFEGGLRLDLGLGGWL